MLVQRNSSIALLFLALGLPGPVGPPSPTGSGSVLEAGGDDA